jgi:5-methyltetrahydropteroyltriglutamate--homocysteine methyltransferase
MLTATKDLVLPTTVTGSWPRPRWFDGRLSGRPLATCLKDVEFREQFTDALSALLTDQERAGLDILTHGDYFHDVDVGGHSWHRYPLERWRGLEGDLEASEELREGFAEAYAPGTILHEVFGAWRWPRAVGRIEPNTDNPLDYAKIWRIAQGRTDRPVKFGSVCAQGIHHFVSVETGEYLDDDRRQLIWDMATAMNAELRELAAAGCEVIQVEEPLIHFLACYQPEQRELIDFLVDAFNHEVSGLDGVEVWIHTCWGNPNMQRAHENPSYAPSAEVYLERLNADVWTIELADGDRSTLEIFAPYRGRLPKKVAIGVVSHRALQVERAEEVADLTRAALRYIDPGQLVLSSDCGFGRQGSNRTIAFYKAVAIVQGANIVRRELGVEERYVPAADPRLQIDLLGRRASPVDAR